ncbi:MAG: DUF1624 domain-containing protein [Methanobrevibacter sp.]|nr:DUF1624 domain-containing protein [Methanobrevibacter sp.]
MSKRKNSDISKKSSHRFSEIDILRGIAVIFMIIYHFFFNLRYFTGQPLPPFFWLQQYYGVITILFVLIAGISLSLAAFKLKDSEIIAKKFSFRGIKLLSIGFFITIGTWFYPHSGFIVFGVLHLIGLSTILSIPFLINIIKEHYKFSLYLPLIFGIVFLVLSSFILKIQGPLYYAFIGIHPSGFYTLDYEPLFPWFSLILFGITLGLILYPQGKRRYQLSSKVQDFLDFLKPISFLGRHSLIIYLIHQPIILGILWLTGIIDLGIF